ncbi:hypothetical protein N473_07320 [Pseudoalteromonas luteoviolacea CPMOR-1]|uniref:Uncharacterized protein n=1 Tax=Pseudoalteromonas luteoviolacea CPMOR-1 TaxID=1365248 RepID=A0A162BTH6_9GAMM|nr:hypothetical protein [Pseudoalteromonas luteoviolacea]KZN68227.1 hypothetical protein N473_07320 [Pseudoalteromonas luteoviolacea CPMOR-1]
MKYYYLVYEDLLGDTSLDDAEKILTNRLKLSPEIINAFFEGKPVVKSSEDKVQLLETFLEKSGIKVNRTTPKLDPSKAQLADLYEKLIAVEEKVDHLMKQSEQRPSLAVGESFDSLGNHFKGGLSKASSLASSLKDASQAKLDQIKMDDNRQPEPPFEGEQTTNKSKFNWVAFFGSGPYYCGYGNIKKGAAIAAATGLIPAIGMFLAIYTGFKANKELPVKQVPFRWPLFAAAFTMQTLLLALVIGFTPVGEKIGTSFIPTNGAYSGTLGELPNPYTVAMVTEADIEFLAKSMHDRMKFLAPPQKLKDDKDKGPLFAMMGKLMAQAQNDSGVSIGGVAALFKSYECLALQPTHLLTELYGPVLLIGAQFFKEDYDLMYQHGVIDSHSYNIITAAQEGGDTCTEKGKQLTNDFLTAVLPQ